MAWLSLVGFSVVLFTFLGVNYLVTWFGLDSMHSYSVGNNNGEPPSLGFAGIIMVFVFIGLLGLALFSWLRIRFPRKRSGKSDANMKG